MVIHRALLFRVRARRLSPALRCDQEPGGSDPPTRTGSSNRYALLSGRIGGAGRRGVRAHGAVTSRTALARAAAAGLPAAALACQARVGPTSTTLVSATPAILILVHGLHLLRHEDARLAGALHGLLGAPRNRGSTPRRASSPRAGSGPRRARRRQKRANRAPRQQTKRRRTELDAPWPATRRSLSPPRRWR